MKILCLNTWGCRVPEIFDYISKNSSSIDVFCFQEVLTGSVGRAEKGDVKNCFGLIQNLLPDYTGYFLEYPDESYYGIRSAELDFKFGLAYFVRKDIPSKDLGGVQLCKQANHSDRLACGLLQAVKINEYTIFNTHGIWQEGGKGDTDARFEQLRNIGKFVEGNTDDNEKKIICGDLNTLPGTDFIGAFDDKYRNLIKEFNIQSTRSNLYKKNLRFADYIFTDNEINVEECYTEDAAVSDHLPIILNVNT